MSHPTPTQEGPAMSRPTLLTITDLSDTRRPTVYVTALSLTRDDDDAANVRTHVTTDPQAHVAAWVGPTCRDPRSVKSSDVAQDFMRVIRENGGHLTLSDHWAVVAHVGPDTATAYAAHR